jgi:hypothetical protein
VSSVRSGWATGARAAGLVIALGYLLGLVRGPVVGVAGGLALVTLGRCAVAASPDDLHLGGALALLAGALGVGVLRWGALDLGDLRGAQAVLGPTLLVGPAAAAAACWAAAGAAVVALATWLAAARGADDGLEGDRRPARSLWGAEAVTGGIAIVSVFWGPSTPRGSLVGGAALIALAGWVLAVAAVTAAAAGGALLVLLRPPSWRTAGLAAAGALTIAAAVVVGAGS